MNKLILLIVSTIVSLNMYLKNNRSEKIKQFFTVSKSTKEQVLTEEWIIEQFFTESKFDSSSEMKLAGWTNPKN